MDKSLMQKESLLRGRRILAVDDEQDVLEIIEEQLEEATLFTASTFEAAREAIKGGELDLVILDIMGVRGFELLEHSRRKHIPAVMLTAHALSPENFQKSIDHGAVSFLPKEQLANLNELVIEILEEVDSGRTHWERLIQRLGPRLKEMWGALWQQIKFPGDHNIRW